MGVRRESLRKIIDQEGTPHWVAIEKEPRMPRQHRQGSIFWRAVLVLILLLAGGGLIASRLPVQTNGYLDAGSITARTLNVPTTTVPPTTRVTGPAALACQALGYR